MDFTPTPNFFKFTRGIRYGCPISALLFILIAEIIAIHILNNVHIKGISVDNSELKIKMLADDTTLLLRDRSSAELAIKEFENFSKVLWTKLKLAKDRNHPYRFKHILKSATSSWCQFRNRTL